MPLNLRTLNFDLITILIDIRFWVITLAVSVFKVVIIVFLVEMRRSLSVAAIIYKVPKIYFKFTKQIISTKHVSIKDLNFKHICITRCLRSFDVKKHSPVKRGLSCLASPMSVCF